LPPEKNVRLEIEAAARTSAELISPFWLVSSSDRPPSWSVSVGDLLAAEERDVVVAFGFVSQVERAGHRSALASADR